MNAFRDRISICIAIALLMFTSIGVMTVPTLGPQRARAQNVRTPNIISGSGATRTLVANQSGSAILLDRAAGIVVTLPAPTVGLTFDFIVTVSVTSNNYKVITSAGTIFLGGNVKNVKTDLTVLESIGDPAASISLLMNGTTTGGLIGTRFRVTCSKTTLWQVDGTNLASGTIATPFSAS